MGSMLSVNRTVKKPIASARKAGRSTRMILQQDVSVSVNSPAISDWINEAEMQILPCLSRQCIAVFKPGSDAKNSGLKCF